MNTKNVCRLCLISKNKIIDFFSDEGIALNITTILDQHFWFQIQQDDNLPNGICKICWKCIKDFHEFYKNIEIIHKNYYGCLEIKNGLKTSCIKSEKSDPINEDHDVHFGSPLHHLNIGLLKVEPIIEIKIEEENSESIAKDDAGKRNSNKYSKSLNRISKIDITKNNRVRKKKIGKIKTCTIKCAKNSKKKDNKKLAENITSKTEEPVNKMEEQQSEITENTITDKENNTNDADALNTDHIFDNKEFIENVNAAADEEHENIAKPLNRHVNETIDINHIRLAEDIKIREFYNLKCEICASQHSTITEVRKHYREAHNTKNGYVLCCNKKLSKRCHLLEHIFWHTNPNEFKCKVCNKIYGNRNGLKIHMHFHSTPEERTYICDVCGAGFTVRYHLMSHFRKTHLTRINKEYKCNQCDKCFTKNSILQSHIRGVHEFKYVNICQICAKVYKSKSQCQIHYLEEHININKPKLKCNLCDAMLKNETSLKCHMRRTHFAEPSECKLCGKIAPNKNALQNHMRYVHAERTHKCNLCDKAFKKPIGLKEHMATHTGNSILYTCPYCTTAFNSQANMHSHRKKKHPVEWLADRHRRLGVTTVNN